MNEDGFFPGIFFGFVIAAAINYMFLFHNVHGESHGRATVACEKFGGLDWFEQETWAYWAPARGDMPRVDAHCANGAVVQIPVVRAATTAKK